MPPGFVSSRPVAETMRDNWVARLKAATGPTRSRLIVRRSPTGDTCALCCRVGAKSTNQTANAARPMPSTLVHGARSRPSGGAPGAGSVSVRGSSKVAIRSGSR